MSSFGLKPILRKNIVILYVWFADSAEIREYLDVRKDPLLAIEFLIKQRLIKIK